MTYAGDIYSWYAGSVEADVYFCPERQGTYFGSFYLKDTPVMSTGGTIDPNSLQSRHRAPFLARFLTGPVITTSCAISPELW
jgi:hypothetical protein